MALILVAPAAMTAPLPDTPRLPRPGDDYWWRLRAQDIDLADGAVIDNWMGDGAAPVGDRQFNNKLAAWSYPTLDIDSGPGGGKAVSFNGSAQINNTTPASTRAQPNSYVIVARNNVGTGIAGARYIGGPTTGQLQNIQPLSLTSIRLNAGTPVDLAFDQSEWFIAMVTFDGDDSLVKLGAADPVALSNPGADVYKGLTIGGQLSAAAVGTGLKGLIAEVRMFNRALTAEEMPAIYDAIAADYGL